MQVGRYVANSFIPRAVNRQLSGRADRAAAPFWMDPDGFANRGVAGAHRPRTGDPALRAQLVRALTDGMRQLLRYEDGNSKAHSIKSRVPFLTPDFATFVLSLPAEFVIDPAIRGRPYFAKPCGAWCPTRFWTVATIWDSRP